MRPLPIPINCAIDFCNITGVSVLGNARCSPTGKDRIGEKLQIWNGLMVYLQIVAFGCFHPTNHKVEELCVIDPLQRTI